jgi:hypothetical protein
MEQQSLPTPDELARKNEPEVSASVALQSYAFSDVKVDRDKIRAGLRGASMPSQEGVKLLGELLAPGGKEIKPNEALSNEMLTAIKQEAIVLPRIQATLEAREELLTRIINGTPDTRNALLKEMLAKVDEYEPALNRYNELLKERNAALASAGTSLNAQTIQKITATNIALNDFLKERGYLAVIIASKTILDECVTNNNLNPEKLKKLSDRTSLSEKAIEQQLGVGQGSVAANSFQVGGSLALCLASIHEVTARQASSNTSGNGQPSSVDFNSAKEKLKTASIDTLLGKTEIYKSVNTSGVLQKYFFNPADAYMQWPVVSDLTTGAQVMTSLPARGRSYEFNRFIEPSALLKNSFVYDNGLKRMIPTTVGDWKDYCIAKVSDIVLDGGELSDSQKRAKLEAKLREKFTTFIDSEGDAYLAVYLVNPKTKKTKTIYITKQGLLETLK